MIFPYPVDHTVPLFLAPMAGISEPPFRLLCRGFGADVVVSEFLSSEGLRRGIKSVHDGAFFTPARGRVVYSWLSLPLPAMVKCCERSVPARIDAGRGEQGRD